MDEDEAALLAELRAISNKSAASRRFADDADDEEENNSNNNNNDTSATSNFPASSPEQENRSPATISGKSLKMNPASSSSSNGPIPNAISRDDDDDNNYTNNYGENDEADKGIEVVYDDDNVGGDDDDDDDILDELLGGNEDDDEEDVFHDARPAESPQKAPTSPSPSSFQNQASSSTFAGERGGAAEDAELLALLRGVSAQSRAVDRFANEDDDDNEKQEQEQEQEQPKAPSNISNAIPAPAPKKRSPRDQKELPPWKRDQAFAKQQAARSNSRTTSPTTATEDVVVSRPEKEGFAGGAGNFKKESSSSTFQGERGGAAEDAELLALLRGVSAKSSSADRFADDDNDNNNDNASVVNATPAPEPAPRLAPTNKAAARNRGGVVPPWKQKQQKAATTNSTEADDVMVVAAPKPKLEPEAAAPSQSLPPQVLMGGAGNFQKESTFAGERGGAAEDAELLALLRGVSAKSSGADRFADDDNDGNDDNNAYASNATPAPEPTPQPKPTNNPAARNRSGVVPPWKQKQQKAAATNSTPDDDVMVVAAPKPARQPILAEPIVEAEARAASPPPPPPEVLMGGAGNFKKESTFAGERGGAAEDAELLALLRGVSAKSSSADRFADDGDDDQAFAPAPAPAPKSIPQLAKKKNTAARSNTEVPPWKRGKAKTLAETARAGDAVVITAPPAPAPASEEPVVRDEPIPAGGGNFKQSSTFAGERGGAAEDEELLALLRGVSAKSSGADRFAEDGEAPPPAPKPAPKPRQPKQEKEPAPVINNAAAFGGAGDFKQKSNFQGERGGAAEDEELLALLRGVSAQSGGTDRFADEGHEKPSAPPAAAATPAKPISSTGMGLPSGPVGMSPAAPPGDDEIVVTRDKLPEYVTDSNWKVRRDSYILLQNIIVESSNGQNASGQLSGDAVLPGLDAQIASYLLDKNASAVEESLQLAVLWADYCQGGSSAEVAETMTKNLIKGNGFTSPRPKATKFSEALVLKLMEVGNGTDSINAIVAVLLDQGLSSKKPKIVQTSTALILEAAQSFGAACLPLAAIKQSLSKMLGHSNKKIRDLGLELVAELCRALGGKSALEDVMEQMKSAQIKELDALLEKQPHPTEMKIGLRSRGGAAAVSPEDAMASLQAGAAELEAERYANRPAVNLPSELKQSEYAQHLKLAKWSEKVTGLNMILECGGEKPYKLMPPSSSVNYAPLISEMKGVLSHTHFAVVSKALEVLSMLAEGAGERLYPHLRPLLPTLLALSKDKKLTKAVSSCLDAFFGNVLSFEHILDADSAISSAADERQEKNALARTAALDFLERCVSRGESAGPRGAMDASGAKNAAQVASEKLGDSDASVRKAAVSVLKALQKVDDPDSQRVVQAVIADLETSQPRVYKQLGGGSAAAAVPKRAGIPRPSPAPSPDKAASPARTKQAGTKKAPSPKVTARKTTGSSAPPPPKPLARSSSLSNIPADFNLGADFTIEDATDYVASLGIPSWNAEDEDGGILAGLNSPKWLFRQNAIKAIAAFVNDRELPGTAEALQKDTAYILVLVKEHTRGFKETNVNVTKSIMELGLALAECHEKESCPIPTWAARDMATLACSKISDKKLCPMSKSLLISICVVQMPHLIMGQSCATMAHIKSPVAQEEFLKWMKSFALEFGAAAIGPGLNETVVFLSEHCDSKNLKVKQAAYAVMGTFHVHLGPPFEALVLSSVKDPSLRNQLQSTFSEHAYDPTAGSSNWPKSSIMTSTQAKGGNGSSSGGGGLGLELPTFDLIAELPGNCLERMGCKESKTAWKARKAAMEEVEATMERCAGLLETSKLKPLVDLLRALRERLSDSQSNLKPVAARLIGSILAVVDAPSQAKLGKVVYGQLISCAMNDQRKVMHDASMAALSIGTSLPKLEGGGPNDQALEPFVIGLVGALEESDFKSAGISDVLDLTKSFASRIPDLDSVASQGGNTLGGRLANVLVQGLSSSKVDIRSSSESLLDECVKNGVIGINSVKKIAGRQKPAIQRAIAPIVAKLSAPASGTQPTSDEAEPEDEEADEEEPPISKRVSIPKPPKQTSRPRTSRVAKESPRVSREVDNSLQSAPRSPRRNTSVSNPLVANVGALGAQKSKAAVKSMTWPEYPEEPSGALVFNALKKAWSPLLPVESAKQLFPDGGIKKQDDAMEGFELLSRAIVMERADEGCAIGEQFSFIWKWMTYVLCCKESTVGLQALLQLASDLVDHLRSISYELGDSEAMVFVPHLFDKSSAAKGRFKDTFVDLMEQIKAEEVLPTKRLGPLVCVAVIEGSSHPKARLLACKECYNCVEKIGLSGIGKRGVLAFAKALSEEKLQENRNALVDLMVMLVSRMNDDMQRFTRICGTSLSGKSRSLIEEQVAKGQIGGQTGIPRSNIAKPSPRREPQRLSTKPKPVKATPSKLPVLRPRQTPTVSGPVAASEMTSDDGFEDELPALDLRFGARATPSGLPRPALNENVRSSPPSRLAFSPPVEALSIYNGSENFSERDLDQEEPEEAKRDENESIRTALFSAPSDSAIETKDSSDSGGAAASLRARLMKIRERNRNTNASVPTSQSNDNTSSTKIAGDEKLSIDANGNLENEVLPDTTSAVDLAKEEALDDNMEATGSTGHLEAFLGTIRHLLSRTLPLAEEDEEIIESTDVLKSLHAAVSRQANLAVNLTEADVVYLRTEVKRNSNEVVETLTRLIDFGFRCHDTDINGGMSVPLLSVNLASLMAIFRSDDISKTVRVEDLTVLIKEAGKALLDPRLASASIVNALDEATSTQMVRAINKLAVQAATGATRHYSFEALMSLQQQLCLKADSSDDPVFNSRLSRVVTKLFSRVVKAEESSKQPFSPSSVDIEAVICFLEDALVACEEVDESRIAQDAILATKNLSRVLVTAVLKARGETGSFRNQMNELEIDSTSSALGRLVTVCASDLGLSNEVDTSIQSSASRDVSALVSAVGEAPFGAERDEAVAALRQYKDEHGDEELNNHLKDVSGAFRQFVLDQLSGVSGSNDQESVASNSMSERIRSLRSKLNATEAAVQQSAVVRSDSISSAASSTNSAPPNVATEAISSKPTAASSASVRAFRERLAAAQEKRTSTNDSETKEIAESTATAGSRAAALRARLQAVKRQAEQPEF